MRIATDRLVLREMTPDQDAGFICKLLNSEGFLKHVGDRGVRTTVDAAAYIEKAYCSSYRDNGHGLYAIELSALPTIQNPKSETAIGICGLVRRPSLPHVDLGFALLPEFEGHGYVIEASEAVLLDGKERLGIETVLAITTQDNSRSHRVLEKLGFNDAGLTKQPHDENLLRLFSLSMGRA